MKRLTTILMSAAVSLTALAQPQLTEKNIDKVLKAMTLEEKAQLLVGSIEGMNYTGVPLPPTGNEAGYQRVPGAAGQTNTIPRLGIPPTVVADGPAGLRITPHRPGDERDYYCTGFPVEILLASSWDTDVLYEVGRAMGEEIREYGVDVILGPATNIMRNPLCGRNFEYYSEDPVLAGKMTAAMVNGVQSQGVGTSVKHFAANNQETNRGENDSRVSQRALREIYLKPFEIAVREAQPWTIMSSYNKVNGEYSQSNYDLLTKVLREDWGFKGIVMTDWTAPRESEKQVAAGNDLLMPGRKAQIEQIVSAVNEDRLSIKEVDACVRRMLEYIVKTPRFQGYKYSEQPDLKAHAAVSRKAAEEGVVLLKNDGVLPLKAGNVALFGIQSYEFLHDGIGSGHVNTPYVVNMVDALEAQGFACNESLAEAYRLHILADKAQWQLSPYGKWPLMESIGVGAPVYEVEFPDYVYTTTAKESDMALVTIGRKPGEGFDRDVKDDFNLSEVEMNLLKGVCDAFHAAGKKVIVVLNVGGVVETASWKDRPDAILLPWMPGQEGGNVVVDILTGKVNPSGHLPITFPVRYEDVPGADDFPTTFGTGDRFDIIGALLHPWKSPDGNTRNYDYTEYNEGIYVGYRHYQTKGVDVSYPFGYGLSYTSFAYSEPSVKRSGNTYTASIKVTNTGSVAGREVIQLYVTAPAGALDKPERELKAFAKTGKLAPGEAQTIEMTFTTYDLASFDESVSAFVADKGTYNARFCTDVHSEQASMEFAVPARKVFPVNHALDRNK